jgi:hypothetical protein
MVVTITTGKNRWEGINYFEQKHVKITECLNNYTVVLLDYTINNSIFHIIIFVTNNRKRD